MISTFRKTMKQVKDDRKECLDLDYVYVYPHRPSKQHPNIIPNYN